MSERLGGAKSLWYLAAVLLAVFTYFYGLDGQNIPKNGDEYPYEHITRLTAASGHLLPLQSELDGMRNTKPPLLFWQGIASTHWGQQWDLWHLRYPSVIYTLLTAWLVFLLARRLSAQAETGFIAALTFLAFFSSYRFGRPFLVNPAEVFWFFLPFFTLLYWRGPAFESRLTVPLLLGVEIGIGLLYKSFALLAPIGLALAWWYWHQARCGLREFLLKEAYKPVLAGAVALVLFALWFAVDPDPQSVWREFVVGENAGKFEAHDGQGYFAKLLWGGSSIWTMLIGYPLDAGLLALPVAALFIVSLRRRRVLHDVESKLWIWLLVFFVVFAVPSQRSARYLLEAMPGVAILCALNWERIPRWTFQFALAAAVFVLGLLGWFAFGLQREADMYGWGFWLLLAVALALSLAALVLPAFIRMAVNVAVLLTFLALAAFLQPFDGAMGNYGEEAQRYVQGKDVWVPCNFRAHFEGDRFRLPGARVHGYDESWGLQTADLAARYRLFAVQQPLAPEPCAGCRVIGQRYEIRGRHSSKEIAAMLKGDVFSRLFVKESLVESSTADPGLPGANKEGCR